MSRNSKLWPRVVAPGAMYHLLASTAFVVVFAIVPFSLYLHSGEEWALTPVLLLKLAGLGLLALLATVHGLRLLAALSRSAAIAIALGLFCLGLFVLLAHVYAPVAIGPLDGEEIRSDEPLSYTLIEVALLAGAVILFILLRRGRGLVAASAFAGILWLVGLGYAVAAAWPTSIAAVVANTSNRSAPASCEAKGSVYQIVLDMLETHAFLELIDDKEWSDEFEGFDLFFNNIANYTITNNSMPSYLTGTFYHSGDFSEWRRSQTSGLLRHLHDLDFATWKYAPFRNWNQPHADMFRSNVDIYSKRIGAPQSEFYEFLRIWLMSLVPNAVTNEMIHRVDAPAQALFALLSTEWQGEEDLKHRPPNADVQTLKSGFHGYASMLLLEQLAIDEAKRGPRCRYVYAHALLPHMPYVVDGSCRYVGDWRRRPEKVSTDEAYLQQAECAARKVIDFLHELKRLGRYETATIVLHADTGTPRPFAARNNDVRDQEVLGLEQTKLLARVRALLMIKPPHSQGPIEMVEIPTQLVDIYPTILDILGVQEPPGLHGRSVYTSAAPPREARFAFDPESNEGPNLIEVRIEDPTNLATSPLTVIGPATDPALWRDEIKRAHARSPNTDEASGSTVTAGGRRGPDRTTQ